MNSKKIFVFVLLFISLILIIFGVHYFYNNHYYSQCFLITCIDEKNDLVFCETSTGFIYIFEGAEDYSEGDYCTAIMFDNFTKYIMDDHIINTRYCGF